MAGPVPQDQLRDLKSAGELHARNFELGEQVHAHRRARRWSQLQSIMGISRHYGNAPNLESILRLERSERLYGGNDAEAGDPARPIEVDCAQVKTICGKRGS